MSKEKTQKIDELVSKKVIKEEKKEKEENYIELENSNNNISSKYKILLDIGFKISFQLVFLFLILLILDYTKIFSIDFYIDLSLLGIITLFLFGLFLTIKYTGSKRIANILPYLFLLSLIVFVIHQYYELSFVTQYKTILISFSVFLGVLSIYFNKDAIDKVEKEKELEEAKEQKRAEEFDSKFKFLQHFNISYKIKENLKQKKYLEFIARLIISPLIYLARIPYSLTKWMYKEGWAFSIAFIILAIIFISIKIAMPIVYTGSYIDEYNHILSGVEFFENGHFAEIYYGSYYDRGAYVSFLVGLFMFLFGKTIFVAKMLPAIIGVINFFLLYKIGRFVLDKKSYVLLLLLLFTVFPWSLFNHFYIRFFVFYEFFILLFTLLFILVIRNIDNLRKVLFYSFLILMSYIILYFFSNDEGMYLILIYTLFFLIYIYFFEMQKIPLKNTYLQFFLKDYKLKLFIFISILILFFYYYNILNLIERFLSGTVTFSSDSSFKYDNLFFIQNLFFSLFFLISIIFIIFSKIKIYSRLIIFSSLFLFLMHIYSSLDLQMARTIMYFLPLFFLVTLISIRFISFNKNILLLLIILLLSLNIYNTYPKDFFDYPYMPTEITYKDYYEASDYLKNLIKDENYSILTNMPHIYKFYNKYNINKIYMLRDNENSYFVSNLKFQELNIWYYTPSKDKIIFGKENFENFFTGEKVIILIDSSFYNSWTLKETRDLIEKNFKIEKEFNGLRIYTKK